MSERQHRAHHPYDRLPDAVTEVFGEEATAESAYDLLTVDVPATEWITALRTARDELGCSYFDWLSAVDEPGTGFRVCAHVAALGGGTVRRLMLRTTVPHDAAVLPSAIDVYAGAAWHERETHEMFGVTFEGHPDLAPLLLPEGFEGHPLRKDFVLAARVAKAWPGAKEPGESEHGGPKRRTMLPPGVPDPNEWGPLKGQLPAATARPGRAARPAAGTADRPPRRTRSASEGSAAQRPQTGPPGASAPETSAPGTPVPGASAPEALAPDASAPGTPASGASAPGTPAPGASAPGTSAPEASAPEAPAPEASVPGAPQPASPDAASPEAVSPSPATAPPGDASAGDVPPEAPTAAAARPRRSRSASDGSASQQQNGPEASAPRPPRRSRSASQGSASQRARATDAPWHDAQPAFDDPSSQPLRRSRSGGPEAEPPVREGAGRGEAPRSGPTPDPDSDAATDEATPTEPKPQPKPEPDPDHPHPAGGDTE
ncbi:NADH-quinone oxidoreductase subunit C [Streptomyces microflavus]|uniref:NADH-quinone oxidoreductase subunit C n=1 Tax=Streptomyces TaxID=1883 RepID=UPI0005157989|nr:MULTISPECIES: NADH-quinone oxidoreductase subunit C [Streptomyces]MDX2975953.1 NADH-quinone oxidoreductase subunit C [Streptomyces sp. NRRL_B-2249]GGX89929.1 dehydrogenase [Streptomyces microflavus]